MIELSDVRVFLTLCEERHFGRTAARLHITQARVSQVVAALERQLGGSLFDRTSRPVTPTWLAVRLYESCSAPYHALVGALDQTRAAAVGDAQRVVLAAPLTINGPELVRIAEAAGRRDPPIRVELAAISPIGDLYEQLQNHTIDILAMWRSPNLPAGLTEGPVLLRSGRVAAIGATHPLADRPSISVLDTDQWAENELGDPGMREVLLPRTTPDRQPITRTTFRSTDVSDVLAQVALGHFVYATADRLAHYTTASSVVFVPITDLPPLEAILITRSADTCRAVQAVIDIARSQRPG